MLVTASWLRVGSMEAYLRRRIVRIVPCFVVAVAFTCLLTLALCPEFRAAVVVSTWFRQIAGDMLGLSDRSLRWPEQFGKNPLSGVANGSLWTIAKEFQCYVLVAVFGLLAMFKRRRLLLAVTVGVWGYFAWTILSGVDTSFLDRRLLVYFLFGVCTWLWRDRIRISLACAFVGVLLLLALSQFEPWLTVSFPLVGGYLTLCLAFGPPWRAFRWTEQNDLSYGVYLYAFPLQQAVATVPGLRDPWLALAVSVPLALVAALASWLLVERPSLRLKSFRPTDWDPAADNHGANRPMPSKRK